MRQPRGEADLLEESIAAERFGQVGAKDLHSDGAIVTEVVGEEHRRHAPVPELPLDAIPVGERRRESLGEIVHLTIGFVPIPQPPPIAGANRSSVPEIAHRRDQTRERDRVSTRREN